MEYLRLFKSITSTRYLIRRVQNRFVAGFLKNKSFETVVDIGAGRAPYKKFVKCKKYIAIDKENRGAANDLILADINSGIPLPDESVDLIIMTEVLEHLKNPLNALK